MSRTIFNILLFVFLVSLLAPVGLSRVVRGERFMSAWWYNVLPLVLYNGVSASQAADILGSEYPLLRRLGQFLVFIVLCIRTFLQVLAWPWFILSRFLIYVRNLNEWTKKHLVFFQRRARPAFSPPETPRVLPSVLEVEDRFVEALPYETYVPRNPRRNGTLPPEYAPVDWNVEQADDIPPLVLAPEGETH